MNVFSVILIVLLAAWFLWAVVYLARHKGGCATCCGKNACNGSCGGCALRGKCSRGKVDK